MISIVLPAYMESDNLRNIIPAISRELQNIDHEILVVDTMEPMDDTESVCCSFFARCIRRRGGNNYGDAIRTGVEEAQGECIVIMDADGSHNPNYIPSMYDVMKNKNCDLVIGSRYCKGGKTDNPAILRLMSYILNLVYRIVFGLKVKDVSNSFRMYKRDLLNQIKLECDNFDIVEELLVKLSLLCKPLNVCEVPIVFNKRDKGKSKRKLLKFIGSYLSTIKRLLRYKKEYKLHLK